MDNSIVKTRSTEIIAAEINSIKDQTKKLVLYNSIEIGRRLCEGKQLVEHGQWGNWLNEKVEFSKSTANNLMKIFEEYGADQLTLLGDNAKNKRFEALSYSQAVALLGVPSEERESFILENNAEDMSARELQKLIKERDKLQIQKENAIKDAEKAKEKVEKYENEKNNLREEVEKLKNQFKDNSELEELREIITRYEEKISEYEMKPITIIPGIDEAKLREIEEEHRKEINKLNKEKEEYKRKLQENKHDDSAEVTRFKVHLDSIAKNFENLLNDISEIKEDKSRYSNAVIKLIDIMKDRL